MAEKMMKLQKVFESRDVSKIAELPISEKELCDRYEKVTTAMVNDVLREDNILYQTLPNNILPLREEMKVAGIAFTLKGSKNLDITDEMEQRAQMLEAIEPDSICVWDTCGDEESAQWGEIMTMASIKRGCRGAIVDGGVAVSVTVTEDPVHTKTTVSEIVLPSFEAMEETYTLKVGVVAY